MSINFDFNTDEYDPEAETVVIRLLAAPNPPSESELVDLLHEEFRAWFGEPGERDRYVPIASEMRAQGLA